MVSGFLTNNFGLAGFLPWGWSSGQGFLSPQRCTGFKRNCLANLRDFCYPLLLSPSVSSMNSLAMIWFHLAGVEVAPWFRTCQGEDEL